MRITYYSFPDEMPLRECYEKYNEVTGKPMPPCITDKQIEYEFERQMSCTITFAKKMLRKFGGYAWTEHIDRDGGVFEVTNVTLTGNNSRHKYNHHL